MTSQGSPLSFSSSSEQTHPKHQARDLVQRPRRRGVRGEGARAGEGVTGRRRSGDRDAVVAAAGNGGAAAGSGARGQGRPGGMRERGKHQHPGRVRVNVWSRSRRRRRTAALPKRSVCERRRLLPSLAHFFFLSSLTERERKHGTLATPHHPAVPSLLAGHRHRGAGRILGCFLGGRCPAEGGRTGRTAQHEGGGVVATGRGRLPPGPGRGTRTIR